MTCIVHDQWLARLLRGRPLQSGICSCTCTNAIRFIRSHCKLPRLPVCEVYVCLKTVLQALILQDWYCDCLEVLLLLLLLFQMVRIRCTIGFRMIGQHGRTTKWHDVTISFTVCHYVTPIVQYCHLLCRDASCHLLYVPYH